MEMGVEKFEAPSALFKTLPHVHLGTTDMAAPGTSSEGVSGLVYDAIQRCEPHMHKDMYSGICLTGGTSNFPGGHAFCILSGDRRERLDVYSVCERALC